jgi:hypothetical protein
MLREGWSRRIAAPMLILVYIKKVTGAEMALMDCPTHAEA